MNLLLHTVRVAYHFPNLKDLHCHGGKCIYVTHLVRDKKCHMNAFTGPGDENIDYRADMINWKK